MDNEPLEAQVDRPACDRDHGGPGQCHQKIARDPDCQQHDRDGNGRLSGRARPQIERGRRLLRRPKFAPFMPRHNSRHCRSDPSPSHSCGAVQATSRIAPHVDDHQLPRLSRVTRLALQLTLTDLTIVMVLSCRSGFVAATTLLDRTMETLSELTELSDLNRILLHLARSREFPDGSSRHGYDFYGRSIGTIAAFADSGMAKTTRSVVSSTSLAARTPRAGSSTTVTARMMTTRPAADLKRMPFGRVNTSRSAGRVASSTRFGLSQSIRSCCPWP